MTELPAVVRPAERRGKGGARKDRQAGRLPAVVYGPETEAVSITVDPQALREIFKQSQNDNTVISLQVEGKSLPVMVRQVQRHPLSREVVHVDFLHVTMSRPVEVMVPVVPQGRPKGAQLGGRLRLIRRTLKARCTYDLIPSSFDVDVSDLDVDDVLKASQVPLPSGVALVEDGDFNVVAVYGKRVGSGPGEEEGAAGGEAAEKAEGAEKADEASE